MVVEMTENIIAMMSLVEIWNWITSAQIDYDVFWMYPIIWLGISATLLISTFLLYIAIMHMKKLRDRLLDGSRVVRWVCYFLIATGLISNTMLNWWVLTITYYELPVGLTFKGWNKLPTFRIETMSTFRIVRHKYESDGLRNKQSLFWCRQWLEPFDIAHCEK